MLRRGVGFTHPNFVPCRRIESDKLLKGKRPAASGIKPSRDLSGLNHKSTRPTHWIEHWLMALVPTFTQHQRGQRFTHRSLSDRFLMATLV